jgi:copper chaperone CopZ
MAHTGLLASMHRGGKKMRKVLTALVAAIAVSAAPAMAQEAAPERPDRDADLVLAVEGFSCDACTAKLEKQLAKLEAAEAVEAAAWEEGTISVWLKEDAEVEDEVLAKTVEDAGFVLKEVRRAAAAAEPAA